MRFPYERLDVFMPHKTLQTVLYSTIKFAGDVPLYHCIYPLLGMASVWWWLRPSRRSGFAVLCGACLMQPFFTLALWMFFGHMPGDGPAGR
jgi:hypothetical protein